jgi:hypothetical protein
MGVMTLPVSYTTAIPQAKAAVHPAATAELRWRLYEACPARWDEYILRFRGGFFHSPLAPALLAPSALPLFATLMRGSEVVGIAAGARSRCRLSAFARHAYFPTMPVLAADLDRDAALGLLLRELRLMGASDASFDSFDADWRPDASLHGLPLYERNEYIVPLVRIAGELQLQIERHHRRHIQRGEREGWRFELGSPRDCAAELAQVSESVAQRAAARGNPFAAPDWQPPRADSTGGEPWGLTAFMAYNDGQLLAAALVGWTRSRAFYIAGGSTPAGYARSAAPWLHLRVMRELGLWHIGAYNLGGVPAVAAKDPANPSHGLHRFKAGFNPQVQTQCGVCWVGRPFHQGVHRIARRFLRASSIAEPQA